MSRTPGSGRLTFEFAEMNPDERLRELILHIADACRDSETFGKTVLNKILWRADFESFVHFRKPLTGAKYQSLERGPAPKRMMPILNEMTRDGDAVVRSVMYHGYEQQRVIALRSANLSSFTGDEITLLNRIIKECSQETAKTLSDQSHGNAWLLGNALGAIPYEAAFLSDEEPSAYHEMKAQELIAEFGETEGWDC
jgi:hypothetical protein